MKTIKNILYFMILIIGISLFSGSFAYEYLGDEDHQGFGPGIQAGVEAYLASLDDGRDIDMDAIREMVRDSIAGDGGWDGYTNLSEQHFNSLARIEGGKLIVGCGNQDLAAFDLGSLGIDGDGIITDSGTVSGSTTSCTLGSYTAYWITSWSTCVASGDWSNSGTISCIQTPQFIPVSATAYGSVTTTTLCFDKVGGGQECSSTSTGCQGSIPPSAPRPTTPPSTRQFSMEIGNPTTKSTTYNNAFANNADKNTVELKISGNSLLGQPITGLGNKGKLSDFTDASNIKSDQISNSGGAALTINRSGNADNKRNGDIIATIDIASKAPFKINNGMIDFKVGTKKLQISNINYSFKKPFTGEINAYNTITNNWTGNPTVGTSMQYRVKANPKSSILIKDIASSYNLNIQSADIKPTDGDRFTIVGPSIDDTSKKDGTGTIFYATINTTRSAESMNNPGLKLENSLPILSYNLDGATVRYYLSTGIEGGDMKPMSITGDEFLGVRIIGQVQSGDSYKSEFTGQRANVSDLSISEQRTIIRKNAIDYVKNMQNGDIVGGVKFVKDQDEVISGNNLGYETLVVENGNVIINNDLNKSGETLGIIVIKDGYNTDSDFNKKGNILITPNVSEINVIMYADGGVISAKNNSGTYSVYDTDSFERTKDLKNQLLINGSIFSRNTIGGAVKVGGTYILPGQKETTSFDKAMVYDLNYLRRGNNDPVLDTNGKSIYSEPLIIKYNSKTSTTPPKLFEK